MPVCSKAQRWPPTVQARSMGAACPSCSGDRTSPPRTVASRASMRRTTASSAFPSLNFVPSGLIGFDRCCGEIQSSSLGSMRGRLTCMGIRCRYDWPITTSAATTSARAAAAPQTSHDAPRHLAKPASATTRQAAAISSAIDATPLKVVISLSWGGRCPLTRPTNTFAARLRSDPRAG